MQKLFLTVVLLLAAVGLSGQNIDKIKGVYFTDTKIAKVSLERTGNLYNGRMIWNKQQGDTKDSKVLVLRALSFDGKGKWTGKIYDPRNDTEYDAEITLSEKGDMNVTGRKGIFKKSFVWTRIS